jgi:hypothetical protein
LALDELGRGVARAQGSVERGRGCAGGNQLLRQRELAFNDFDELADGLRAHDRHAVDAKNRRASNAQALGERHIVVDLCGGSACRIGGLEGVASNASLRGPDTEAARVERALVGKDEIVKFPKRFGATQSKDGRRRFGRRSCAAMKRQRIVLPNETNLVGSVHASQFVERPTDTATERALEIAELDDGHGRQRIAPRRISLAHRHHRSVVLRCRLGNGGGADHRCRFGLRRRSRHARGRLVSAADAKPKAKQRHECATEAERTPEAHRANVSELFGLVRESIAPVEGAPEMRGKRCQRGASSSAGSPTSRSWA